MNLRATLLMVATTAPMAVPAIAGTNDILIGLDEKITIGPSGQVNSAPGRDAVLVMDVSDPAKPRIRASLPLINSLVGPPTNLQITPDGALGLVANSLVMNQDGGAWKTAPDNKLFVIDLNADPPKLARYRHRRISAIGNGDLPQRRPCADRESRRQECVRRFD